MTLNSISLLLAQQLGGEANVSLFAVGDYAAVQPKALLIADNLCLRQQLLLLHRRKPRPRPEDADRRFWVLVCRWFADWQASLLIVKPETIRRWHRHGWRTYWRPRTCPSWRRGLRR